MGCDIHLHTEIKVNGVWHHYSQPRIGRSYHLFCKMAGVRGPIDGIVPVSEPRGLPDGLSFTTNLDIRRWTGDGHSFSWLTSVELAAVIKWNDERMTEWKKRKNAEDGHPEYGGWYSTEHEYFGYLFGNGWDLEKYRSDYPAEIEDVRAVFWFDN